MSEHVTVKVILKVSGGAKVAVAEPLDLSLDCFICQRRWRTVILQSGKETGICTPTKHLFPAKILSQETTNNVETIEIKYCVEYWFAPFLDSKHKTPAEDILNWGRVNFEVTCPKCGETKPSSVQNNTVRPWTCYCSCGFPLYFETEEYPKFEKKDF